MAKGKGNGTFGQRKCRQLNVHFNSTVQEIKSNVFAEDLNEDMVTLLQPPCTTLGGMDGERKAMMDI